MTLRPCELSRDGVHFVVGRDGPDTIAIAGTMDDPRVDTWLTPLVREIHRAAVETDCAHVVLDIRRLAQANSASWRCLVSWLKLMRSSGEGHYVLRLIWSREQRWQEVGMAALRVFGANRLILE